MIEIKNLRKEYKLGGELIKAVDDISLKIDLGEMLAIVGPSGSGKSTLMHLMGGLDMPDSGEIIVDGVDITKMKSAELARYRNKYVGFVFQTFNLQPNLTALENVALPLVFSGIKSSKRKEMATEALRKVDLLNRINHKPAELSGGQRQRVSIARALVNSPKIVFADEPTGNLDSKTEDNILEMLKELNQKEKVTIAIVTHDEYVARASNRIIQLKDGKLTKLDDRIIKE